MPPVTRRWLPIIAAMKPLVPRDCPVCGAHTPKAAPQPLHQRRFAQLPGLDSASFVQQLVACGDCGAIHVSAYLAPGDLAAYYGGMSSYEYLESEAEFPREEALRSQRQVDFLRPYLAGTDTPRVLDVGCSIGHTLHLLREQGCAVRGVEPSLGLSRIARQRYGIEVDTRFIDAGSQLPDGQHLVLLSHVLEHLLDPMAMLTAIRRALRPDGLLFIEVPAIELFDERDLFQLSFEHVNYFSHGSLGNLMRRAGFAPVEHVVFENDDGSSPHYPTLGTLWQPDDRPLPMVPRGAHDVPVLRRYLALIDRHARALDERLAPALAAGGRLVIWGAGTLSAQLLANTVLAGARERIAGVLDIDPKKHGLRLDGLPVHHAGSDSGRALLDSADTVVIGSWSSQQAIHDDLLARGVAPRRILKLFGA